MTNALGFALLGQYLIEAAAVDWRKESVEFTRCIECHSDPHERLDTNILAGLHPHNGRPRDTRSLGKLALGKFSRDPAVV